MVDGAASARAQCRHQDRRLRRVDHPLRRAHVCEAGTAAWTSCARPTSRRAPCADAATPGVAPRGAGSSSRQAVATCPRAALPSTRRAKHGPGGKGPARSRRRRSAGGGGHFALWHGTNEGGAWRSSCSACRSMFSRPCSLPSATCGRPSRANEDCHFVACAPSPCSSCLGSVLRLCRFITCHGRRRRLHSFLGLGFGRQVRPHSQAQPAAHLLMDPGWCSLRTPPWNKLQQLEPGPGQWPQWMARTASLRPVGFRPAWSQRP